MMRVRIARGVLLCAVLAGCEAGGGAVPDAAAGQAGLPDRVLLDPQLIMTVNGATYADVRADSMYVNEDSSSAQLFGVRVSVHDSVNNQLAELSAGSAHYDLRTQVLQAQQSVVVRSAGGDRVEAERMTLDPAVRQFSSDAATRFIGGNGAVREFDGFTADDRLRRPGPGRAAPESRDAG